MKKQLAISFLIFTLSGCPSKTSLPNDAPAQPRPTQSVSGEETLQGALQADVQLNKESYYPGDEIEVLAVAVGLSDSAWVGVVPSDVPHGKESDNDSNDLGYVYLNQSGPLLLVAPKEPGEYDVRLNDDDNEGTEIASRTFKVEVDPNPVTEPQILWQPEGPVKTPGSLEIPFESLPSYAGDAWIGIVPSATAHGKESDGDAVQIGYAHLNGRSRGKITLDVPSVEGDYDVRMYSSDDPDTGKEVASVSFKVAESE